MDLTNCPRCLKSTSSTANRLITENCGHIKCRECFIDELNGCLDCLKDDESSASSKCVLKHSPVEKSGNPRDTSIKENLFDMESNSADLWCIDTEESEDSTIENLPDTEMEIKSGDPAIGVNLIHNSSSRETQEAAMENKAKLEILEEFIIAPKSKIEKFFREKEETTENSSDRETFSKVPKHVVKISEDEKQLFRCTICDKTFRSSNQVYYHMHCDNVQNKPHKCKVCAKHFSTSSHFTYHMRTHNETKKYACHLCPKEFQRNSSLQLHAKVHQGIFKFECKQCGAKFNERTLFMAHKNKHANILPFVCKTCGKKFSFRSNLSQHQATHRGDVKRFRCEECGREFGRKNSYKEHKIRHSKVKDFACTICQKSFIDRKTLGRHMKTHGGFLVYNCPCCSVQSARKDNLVRHIRNMHPKEHHKDMLAKITLSKDERAKEDANQATEFAGSNSKDERLEKEAATHPTETIKKQPLPIVAVSSSVIRSVGNVKPVQIPNDCDIMLKESSDPASVLPKIDTTTAVSNSNAVNKKLKKKYDPCEIYRKILFASNDCDDSVLGTEELYSDSKDEHIGCCEPDLVAGGSGNRRTQADNIEPYNFTEMHWRKKASQFFHTSSL